MLYLLLFGLLIGAVTMCILVEKNCNTPSAEQIAEACKNLAKQLNDIQDIDKRKMAILNVSFEKFYDVFKAYPSKFNIVSAIYLFEDVIDLDINHFDEDIGRRHIIAAICSNDTGAAIFCMKSQRDIHRLQKLLKKHNKAYCSEKEILEQAKFNETNMRATEAFANGLLAETKAARTENQANMQKATDNINDIVNGIQDINTVQSKLLFSTQAETSKMVV